VTRHTASPPRTGCRLHGPDCLIAWGYDPAHTDSRRPYTLDELAERTAGPHRYAYPTADAYREGWALWRALRRDSEPTHLERMVKLACRLAPLAADPLFGVHHHTRHCPVLWELVGLIGAPEGFETAAAQMCACTHPGWAAKPDRRVTEQSDNHHSDPRPPAGPSGVRVGTDRTVALRTVSARTPWHPHPADVSEAESRSVL
jgi:hypothetical protein